MLSYLYVNNVKINEPTALAARKKQQNFKFAMRFKHQNTFFVQQIHKVYIVQKSWTPSMWHHIQLSEKIKITLNSTSKCLILHQTKLY